MLSSSETGRELLGFLYDCDRRENTALLSIEDSRPTHELTGNDYLHNLRGTIGKLEAESIPQPLLQRVLLTIANVAVKENAIMNSVESHLRAPPLAHRRFLYMSYPLVAEIERPIAE